MYKLGSIHDSTRFQECTRMYYIRDIASLLYVGLEDFVVWHRGTVVSEVHFPFTFMGI